MLVDERGIAQIEDHSWPICLPRWHKDNTIRVHEDLGACIIGGYRKFTLPFVEVFRKDMLVVLFACGEHLSSTCCIDPEPSRSGSAEVDRGLGR